MFKLFSSTLTIATLLAPACFAKQIDGTYQNELSELYAVAQTGTRAPDGDAFCKETFGKFLGTSVSGEYSINTETLIMSATAVYNSATVKMFPLGIEGRYAFMGTDIPQPLSDMHISRVILNMSTDFESKESDIMFNGNDTYNCILSNLPAN